jgi:hypothetical protein
MRRLDLCWVWALGLGLWACDSPRVGADRVGDAGAADADTRPVTDAAAHPDGAIVFPDAAVVLHDGAIAVPDAVIALADAAVVLPDAAVMLPDAAVVLPDAAVVLPDAAVALPDAAVVLPDAAVALPDAAVALPDAAVVLPDAAVVRPDAAVALPDAALPPGPTPGELFWRDTLEPALIDRCGECHVGERFAFLSLARSGDVPTPEESARNRAGFQDLLNFDAPAHSRLRAKVVPLDDPNAIVHHGPRLVADDALLVQIDAWISAERAETCPDCGLDSPTAFIAYVQQPEAFWMVEAQPIRSDRGVRAGARVMLQPVVPATLEPVGEPVDFLGDFCPDGDDCDWGKLAVDPLGMRMAFECRIGLQGESWVQRAWNICLAEIGPDGRAVNPRFLRPPAERHTGITYTRTDPFGVLAPDAFPSPYDKHFELRRRNDREPVFSPDGEEICFLSADPEPRSGADMVQTYHGTYHLEHLVCTDLQGGNRRTLYRNEGGQVDSASFRRNGRVVFHTWNLERMDRNMYVQAEPDGMMELPVFLGRMQGPNAWGTAFELADGRFFGLTGRRRATAGLYTPFLSDHTLGISNVAQYPAGEDHGFNIVWSDHHAELDEFGFCRANTPEEAALAPRCSLSFWFGEPAYAPDGGALFSYNPERTYLNEGEGFTLTYARGASTQALIDSARPYFPKHMGIGRFSPDGTVSTLLPNPPGTMLRNPVWVGVRHAPRVLPRRDAPERPDAELTLLDARLWLSFDESSNGFGSKVPRMARFDRIVALRVLRKIADGNACIDDGRYIRMTNASSDGFHPTALGFIDSTGYERYAVPEALGGDAWGDIPLAADGSVKLRLPAGELLLFQGVDAAGNVIGQHRRVFALPPGRSVETGVKRADYHPQCARCHGVIDVGPAGDFLGASDIARMPAVMDHTSLAGAAPPVDLLDPAVSTPTMTWRAQFRPVVDAVCVGCHAGEAPAGGLSLQAEYSETGQLMAGPAGDFPNAGYLDLLAATVGADNIVRSYNASVAWAWLFAGDHDVYRTRYAAQIDDGRPLGALGPWDAGYQNVFQRRADGFYYLNVVDGMVAYGRVAGELGNASRSFLLEVLTGEDRDPRKDYAGAYDHRGLLDPRTLRTWAAVMDVGLPYAARCGEKLIPDVVDGPPHAGEPWGEAVATPWLP